MKLLNIFFLFSFSESTVMPHPPEEPVFFIDEFPSVNITTTSATAATTVEARKRRSIPGNVHRSQYVETLVVVDKYMVKKHGRDKVTAYVLTVFNMVSNGHIISYM